MFLTDEIKLKLRLVLAIAYGASIGGIVTPIGTPPNLILLGFMEQHSIESIAFVKWILLTGPLSLVMLLIIPFVLSIGVNDLKFDTKLEDKQNLNFEQKKTSIYFRFFSSSIIGKL